jgi:hypothetical protein
LIAKRGQSGGHGGVIEFRDRSDGGQASVQVFGNGTLQIVNSVKNKVTIGSLEGDGVVSMVFDRHPGGGKERDATQPLRARLQAQED